MPAFELAVPEDIRPRVARRLGIPLDWDVAVDTLSPPALNSFGGILAAACRLYRQYRPRRIGDRCAFEPSCSRYAELSFRLFGLKAGLGLAFKRISRCKACNGGLDLPPTLGNSEISSLEERVCSIG